MVTVQFSCTADVFIRSILKLRVRRMKAYNQKVAIRSNYKRQIPWWDRFVEFLYTIFSPDGYNRDVHLKEVRAKIRQSIPTMIKT